MDLRGHARFILTLSARDSAQSKGAGCFRTLPGSARHPPIGSIDRASLFSQKTGVVVRSVRINSLDTVRGLAALSVVFLHILSAYRTQESWSVAGDHHLNLPFLLSRTPLGIFYAGGSAVVLFFILSGFVLALPFLAGRAPRYRDFAIRRVCRIYLPYAAALFIAIGARSLVTVAPVAGADWVRSFWDTPLTPGIIAGYLAMTGFSYHTAIDFVVWSLIHEMRISLIFPLLIAAMALTSRLSLRLAGAFLLSFGAALLALQMRDDPSAVHLAVRSWLDTIGYIWFFIVGIELARYRQTIMRFIAARSRTEIVLLTILSACLYCARLLVPSLEHTAELDFIIGIGAAGFIALAIGRAHFDRWLTKPPLLFLGRTSYSLYLLHPIVLLTAIYALSGLVPPAAIMIIVAPLALLAAWLGWRFIEKPSMELGRTLSRRPAAVGSD
jgi:peptidoglycan/LPS O-acetylase OafA/YrhL